MPPVRLLRTLVPLCAALLGTAAVAGAQVLDAPDPAQMEDAPDLGYHPVPHGLQIPDGQEMGAPSSVVWTTKNTLLVFNQEHRAADGIQFF